MREFCLQMALWLFIYAPVLWLVVLVVMVCLVLRAVKEGLKR